MDTVKKAVIEAIKTVYDPEIPVNIWEVGLIYEVDVADRGQVRIVMTLTSPMCPVAESLPIWVEQAVEKVDGVENATVEITWDPPWDPEMMSEAAQLELGMY
jgi:FeS assembly SUF system protein